MIEVNEWSWGRLWLMAEALCHSSARSQMLRDEAEQGDGYRVIAFGAHYLIRTPGRQHQP